MIDPETTPSTAPRSGLFAAISRWLKINIIGDGTSSDFTSNVEKAGPVTDEQIRQTMEDTEFMPPPVVTANGEINRDSVHFVVKKLVETFIDMITSGLLALLLWIVIRVSGKTVPESPYEEWADKLQTAAPAIIWILCYLRLTFRRLRRRPT